MEEENREPFLWGVPQSESGDEPSAPAPFSDLLTSRTPTPPHSPRFPPPLDLLSDPLASPPRLPSPDDSQRGYVPPLESPHPPAPQSPTRRTIYPYPTPPSPSRGSESSLNSSPKKGGFPAPPESPRRGAPSPLGWGGKEGGGLVFSNPAYDRQPTFGRFRDEGRGGEVSGEDSRGGTSVEDQTMIGGHPMLFQFGHPVEGGDENAGAGRSEGTSPVPMPESPKKAPPQLETPPYIPSPLGEGRANLAAGGGGRMSPFRPSSPSTSRRFSRGFDFVGQQNNSSRRTSFATPANLVSINIDQRGATPDPSVRGGSATPPLFQKLERNKTAARPQLERTLTRNATRTRLGDPRMNGMFAKKPGKETPIGTPGGNSTRSERSRRVTRTSGVERLERVEEDDEDPFDGDEGLPDDWKSGRWLSGWNLVQLLLFVTILAGNILTSTVPALKGSTWLGLQQWKWLLLAQVIFSGRLVSQLLVRLLVFIIERHWLLKKRVLYFVYALRRGLANTMWLALVLAVWNVLIEAKVQEENKDRGHLAWITTSLVGLLVSSILYLANILLLKTAASRFHVARFFDRIQEALFKQHVLETLSAPPMMGDWVDFAPMVLPQDNNVARSAPSTTVWRSGPSTTVQRSVPSMTGRRSSTGGQSKLDEGTRGSSVSGDRTGKAAPIPIKKLERMSQKNVSAWGMKRLMHVIRHQGITTYSGMLDCDGEEISSEVHAKIAAKQIFHNVATPGRKVITHDDFLRFFTEDEVANVWPLFEGAKETGTITRKVLKAWVVAAYKERVSLSLTMNDTKTVVRKLHRVMNVLAFVVIVLAWLVITGVFTTKVLVLASTLLVSWAIIFGNMARTTFESIIFLFVMHPFDVGDRVRVDDWEGIVEEMNILTTVFLRGDCAKVSYPNSVLALKPIQNLYRSPHMWDDLTFQVDHVTPPEKLDELKNRLCAYAEARPHELHAVVYVVCKGFEEGHRMNVACWFAHAANWQDGLGRWNRRHALTFHLIKCLQELGMQYQLLPQTVNLNGELPPGLAFAPQPKGPPMVA